MTFIELFSFSKRSILLISTMIKEYLVKAFFSVLVLLASINVSFATIPDKKEMLSTLEMITTRLQTNHTVRVIPQLKFSPLSNQIEIEARKEELKMIMERTISGYNVEELKSLEGKDKLKSELKTSMNSILKSSEVLDIFYTSFQINSYTNFRTN